jgi:hypothetical protein
VLDWDEHSERYARGWFVGSAEEDGLHRRDAEGWPYSIYKRGCQPGVGDAILCYGLQDLADAEALCSLLNRTPKLRVR